MKTTDMKTTNDNTKSIPQISKISDDDLENVTGGANILGNLIPPLMLLGLTVTLL